MHREVTSSVSSDLFQQISTLDQQFTRTPVLSSGLGGVEPVFPARPPRPRPPFRTRSSTGTAVPGFGFVPYRSADRLLKSKTFLALFRNHAYGFGGGASPFLRHEHYKTHDERCLQRNDTHVCQRPPLIESYTAPITSCPRAQPWESCHLAGFRCRLSRGVWLFPRFYGSFFPFGCGPDRRWQFHLGLFRSAMVAMVQRPDARSFFGHP